jgi:hypothetical protein
MKLNPSVVTYFTYHSNQRERRVEIVGRQHDDIPAYVGWVGV